MSASVPLTLQYIVVAVMVAASAWVVFLKQAPNVARRIRIALALPLVRESRPSWVRALGKRIAPAPKPAGDACGGCNSCDTGSAS